MGYTIRRSDAFDSDLEETVGYLTGTLCSAHAAMKFLDEVERVAELVSENPFLNAVSGRFGCDRGLREQPILNYVAVYRVVDDEVVFLRLFHQMQKYERFVVEWN